jgi:hypothetical protein
MASSDTLQLEKHGQDPISVTYVAPVGASELEAQHRVLVHPDSAASISELEAREQGTPRRFVVNEPYQYQASGLTNSRPDSTGGAAMVTNNTTAPEINHTFEESEEELQQRLRRIKEEREMLLRINELSQLESQIKASLAARRST